MLYNDIIIIIIIIEYYYLVGCGWLLAAVSVFYSSAFTELHDYLVDFLDPLLKSGQVDLSRNCGSKMTSEIKSKIKSNKINTLEYCIECSLHIFFLSSLGFHSSCCTICKILNLFARKTLPHNSRLGPVMCQLKGR